MYDAATTTLTDLGFDPVGGPSLTVDFSGGWTAFPGWEGYDTPAVDLNGDGDESDYVLQVWDGIAPAATNVGVALDPLGSNVWSLGDGGFLVGVDEARQGATDLNGDGDAIDRVAHIWSPGGGLVNLGVTIPATASNARNSRAAASRRSESTRRPRATPT